MSTFTVQFDLELYRYKPAELARKQVKLQWTPGI